MNLSDTKIGDTVFYGATKTRCVVEVVYDDRLGVRMPGGYLLFCRKSDVITVPQMAQRIEDRIYKFMCADCEREQYCHIACENCEEFEDALVKEGKQYGISF